jgi:hypothetical protein
MRFFLRIPAIPVEPGTVVPSAPDAKLEAAGEDVAGEGTIRDPAVPHRELLGPKAAVHRDGEEAEGEKSASPD